MCAAKGILRVAGYEKLTEVDMPVAVTRTCEIGPAARASGE